MWNLYSEIKDDLKPFADLLEDNSIPYKAYNHGVQLNATDAAGITQSFYPTTGTIVFHRSNDRSDRAVFTIKESNIESFIDFLNNPEKIQKFFEE